VSDFWPTVLSVVPLARCVVCRLSVCRRLWRFVLWRNGTSTVLAKNCLKEWIGNQGQKVDFFGSLPYFYFRFRRYGHRDGRFCLIFARTAQRSVLDGTNGLSGNKPCAYCRTVWSELKLEVVFKVQKMARYASFCLRGSGCFCWNMAR